MSLRLILDTNTLVSALIFTKGRLAWLRHAWQSGRLIPLICRETADELLRVLAYPKFKLDRDEIEALLADFLPYAETVASPVSAAPTPRCRDPKDQVFVDLLLAAHADGLITGDKDLLALASDPGLPIQTPAALREQLGSGG